MNTQFIGLILIFIVFFVMIELGDYCTQKRIEERIKEIKSNKTNKDLTK